MGEERSILTTREDLTTDPGFRPYADLFKGGKRVRFGVPAQRTMGPEHFCGEFFIQYQVSQEDADGEFFDFRVFYKEVNGQKVALWINRFNQYFCKRVIDPIVPQAPLMNVHQAVGMPPLRNQIDFLALAIPGRFIEEVITMYFRLLKEKT